MPANTKRAYARCVCEVPIIYKEYDTGKYHHAKIYNSSTGGMYFESDHSVQPESDIYIKMINYAPDTSGPEVFKAYRARVKWCNKRSKTGTYCYGIGIQYLDKSHTVYGGNVHGSSCSCDLCGEKVPSEGILENEDLVCLCMDCFNYLEGFPEGWIKESIKKFLIGNVI